MKKTGSGIIVRMDECVESSRLRGILRAFKDNREYISKNSLTYLQNN